MVILRVLLVAVALLPGSLHSLTVRSALNRGTSTCPAVQCKCSAPVAINRRGQASNIGFPTGDNYISSTVGRIERPVSVSARWDSLAPVKSYIDVDLENKLLGIDNERAKLEYTLDEQEHSAPNSRPKYKAWIFVTGGVALALVISLTILPEGWVDPSLAVRQLLAEGIRSSFVVGQVSVGFAALRENFTREPAANYLQQRALPVVWDTVKKMLLMEFWRRVWMVVFRQTKKGLHFIAGKATTIWTKYCPFWIQRGFQSIFKKTVEKRVQAWAGFFTGHIWTMAGKAWKIWNKAEVNSFVPASGTPA
mmetsp:Transcript_61805/g.182463  ORF Transcript_61805/g.182463 Transcript_61805/m.182463 type:complete len:307 (-) Transcript_61805:346-1266(-)